MNSVVLGTEPWTPGRANNLLYVWEETNPIIKYHRTKAEIAEDARRWGHFTREWRRYGRMSGNPRDKCSSMRKRRRAYYAFTKPVRFFWTYINTLPTIPREGTGT